MSAEIDCVVAIRRLEFRPERSRPVWRNLHTGRTAVVLDLSVDDNGGFQGGCRRFIVQTDENGPAGWSTSKRAYELSRWLTHWEPTGEHIDWPRESDPWMEHAPW